MTIPFHTVDVFTRKPFNGAQIAVVPNAESIDDKLMQSVAEELNFWSTVFITPVNTAPNHFRLRVFTPASEIGFGSHTTIAAAHILAATGKVGLEQEGVHTPLVFKTNSSDISAHVTRQANGDFLSTFSLTTEPVVDNYAPSSEELAGVLGLEGRAIGNKPFTTRLVSSQGIYIVVPIRKFDDIRRATFDNKRWQESTGPNTLAEQILVFSQQTDSSRADFHLRLLGPDTKQGEDPPVGSAMPAFSAYLCAHPHITKGTYSFIAERGLAARRQSLIHVEIDNQPAKLLTMRVGGHAKMVCEGVLHV